MGTRRTTSKILMVRCCIWRNATSPSQPSHERPCPKSKPLKKRMGWRFTWVSSYGSDFNYDYRASFTQEDMAQGKVDYNFDLVEFPSTEVPGISIYYRDKHGNIFHTYSSYARGTESVSTRTTISTLVPRATMMMACPSRCPGSAITIVTRMAT